jgi:3-oxoacyl-[acyl-carrier protein] reductase
MEGTTFNSVSVGFTKTEAYDRIPSEIKNKLTVADAADVAVANRIGEVEDIAGVVGLLVSEKARVSVERHRVGVSLIEFSGSLEV